MTTQVPAAAAFSLLAQDTRSVICMNQLTSVSVMMYHVFVCLPLRPHFSFHFVCLILIVLVVFMLLHHLIIFLLCLVVNVCEGFSLSHVFLVLAHQISSPLSLFSLFSFIFLVFHFSCSSSDSYFKGKENGKRIRRRRTHSSALSPESLNPSHVFEYVYVYVCAQWVKTCKHGAKC